MVNVIARLMDRIPALAVVRPDLEAAAALLISAVKAGHKILVCGNGGSAADAEHIASELLKGFRSQRRLSSKDVDQFKAVLPEEGDRVAQRLQYGVPTITLTGHPGLATAYLNDVDPYFIFAQQTFVLGQPGDVLWAISTSGNSQNVVNACLVAKARGLKVLGLTGRKPNRVSALSDVCLRVPQQETFLVQELHLPVYHALCECLEVSLFGDTPPIKPVEL